MRVLTQGISRLDPLSAAWFTVRNRNRHPRRLTVEVAAVAIPADGLFTPMFHAAKDALASQAARSFVNGMIQRYGEVRDLKINSKEKTVDIVCLLKGEPEPVRVRVDSYRIESEGNNRFIKIQACSCSRVWLQHLIEDHVSERRLKLPTWAAAAL
jgi:hypothetical protein